MCFRELLLGQGDKAAIGWTDAVRKGRCSVSTACRRQEWLKQARETLPAPVLVHRASGKRSGAMVMMHLGAEQGLSGAEVIERASSMSFECDTPELGRFVRGYVDRHIGQ